MADDEAETEKPRKKGKLLLIVGLVVLSLLAAVGGVVVALGPQGAMALLTGEAPEPVMAEDGEGTGELPIPEAEETEMVELLQFDEMIVNITSITATGRKTTRFLKLDFALTIDTDVPGAERLAERELFLRDSVQDYLRQLTEDDLSGSAGLALLKAEILRRARAVADSDAPKEVLISDLVIQ